jgi:hypothetical protein
MVPLYSVEPLAKHGQFCSEHPAPCCMHYTYLATACILLHQSWEHKSAADFVPAHLGSNPGVAEESARVLSIPHPGHTFVPDSEETYGHLGRPIMRYLRTLSDVASARFLDGTQGSLLACAHRELSVALVQSPGSAYRSCPLLLAKASGRTV